MWLVTSSLMEHDFRAAVNSSSSVVSSSTKAWVLSLKVAARSGSSSARRAPRWPARRTRSAAGRARSAGPPLVRVPGVLLGASSAWPSSAAGVRVELRAARDVQDAVGRDLLDRLVDGRLEAPLE